MGACDDIREELSAYLDGELPQEARAACESHLQACEPCRDALADLQAASAAVAALPKLKAPAGLAARVRQEVLAQPKPLHVAATHKDGTSPASVAYATFWHRALFGVAALVMLSFLAFIVLPALAGRMREGSVAKTTDHPKKTAESAAAPATAPEAKQAAPEAAAEKKPAPDASRPTEARREAEDRDMTERAAAEPPRSAKPWATPGEALGADGLRKGGFGKGAPPAPVAGTAPRGPAPAQPPATVATVAPATKAAGDKTGAANALDAAARMRRGVAGEGAADRAGKDAIPEGKTGAPPVNKLVEKAPAAKEEFRAKGKAGGLVAADEENEALKRTAGPGRAELPERKILADAAKQQRSFGAREGEAAGMGGAGAAGGTRGGAVTEAKQKEEAPGRQPIAGGGAGAPAALPGAAANGKPAAVAAAPEKQNREVFKGGKVGALAAAEAPAEQAPVQGQRQVTQGKALGLGDKASTSAEVLVFQTQDPERLLAQLRELARQNGARCEVAVGLGARTAKKSEAAEDRKRDAEAGVAQPAKSRETLEIVTTPERRAALLAQLRALQSAQPLAEELRAQRDAGRPRTQTAEDGAFAQPAAPAAAQKERKLDDVDPAAAQLQGADSTREARILIRIEIMPSK
ncbi:MAG: anti-sigma factor [Planctomycetota bacterium]|nr:anti-sigma factor [Planctomycetota bacterium]